MTRWVAVTLVGTAVAGLLFGCYPEKRVVWSPDGQWAAVLGGDGLRLSDAQGKLSELLAAGATRAAWLPDSQRLVVTCPQPVKSWSELSAALPAGQRERIAEAGAKLREQMLAYDGDWEAFEPKGLEELTGGERGATFLYIKDVASEGLAEKLGERWDELKELQVDLWALQLFEVAQGSATPGQVLCRRLDEESEPRVAPDAHNVSFTAPMAGEKPKGVLLYVVPIDGGRAPELVADDCSWFADWTPDSRYLVFAQAPGWNADEERFPTIGVVARREVADAAGALLSAFPDAEDLARVPFQAEIKVRALKDGRIIFSAFEQHFPAAAQDEPERASLFAISPDQTPVVSRITPRQAECELPKGPLYFEVSPEEHYIALMGHEGRVQLLMPATGEIWPVMTEGEIESTLVMMPTWRSADELCYLAPPAEGEERAAITLLKLNWPKELQASRSPESWARQEISRDWPEAVARGFLVPVAKGEKPEAPGEKSAPKDEKPEEQRER
jgi:hypothetical protein